VLLIVFVRKDLLNTFKNSDFFKFKKKRKYKNKNKIKTKIKTTVFWWPEGVRKVEIQPGGKYLGDGRKGDPKHKC